VSLAPLHPQNWRTPPNKNLYKILLLGRLVTPKLVKVRPVQNTWSGCYADAAVCTLQWPTVHSYSWLYTSPVPANPGEHSVNANGNVRAGHGGLGALLLLLMIRSLVFVPAAVYVRCRGNRSDFHHRLPHLKPLVAVVVEPNHASRVPIAAFCNRFIGVKRSTEFRLLAESRAVTQGFVLIQMDRNVTFMHEKTPTDTGVCVQHRNCSPNQKQTHVARVADITTVALLLPVS